MAQGKASWLAALVVAALGAAIGPSRAGESATTERLRVLEASGALTVWEEASSDTYVAYFEVPVATDHQTPLLVEVSSPELVDFRFVELAPPNRIVAARLRRTPPETPLSWRAWVLVRDDLYEDRPVGVPFPQPEELPESVRPWLQPTDCVQTFDPEIQAIAADVRGDLTTVDDLAVAVSHRVLAIPGCCPHSPMAFDAYYAFSWGSSCTGHAHAAAALFRANGVPARSLHVIPASASYYPIDMHWIIEYWLPTYGWVPMDPGWVMQPALIHNLIVTLVCAPEDEFPLFLPSGIEGHWHTSDPALGMYSPDWGGAHLGQWRASLVGDSATVREAWEVTRQVYELYAQLQGITVTADQQAEVDAAVGAQTAALDAFLDRDLGRYNARMREARTRYWRALPFPLTTVWADDFESGAPGWTHGGGMDEWELGVPELGPTAAHSGESCWGTDLDGDYECNADNWLLSPPFSLEGLASASLELWAYVQVDDLNQGLVYDPLWMDVTRDGSSFEPLCSHMGGGNDDPAIPEIGGWSRVVLDLTPYAGEAQVQVRFRFQSDDSGTQAGAYVDDVKVAGRRLGSGRLPRRVMGRPQ